MTNLFTALILCVKHNQAVVLILALAGLGKIPTGYDPLADVHDQRLLDNNLKKMRGAIAEAAQQMPDHLLFIEDNLSA